MIIINEAAPNDKVYTVRIGADDFCLYAENENEAVDVVAEYFISRGDTGWYYDALEVELMANSVSKTVPEFIEATDLRHCPKHNIYLPKCRVEEVSI